MKLLLLFLMLFCSCSNPVPSIPLSHYKLTVPPSVNSSEWIVLKSSSANWFSVAIVEGQLQLGKDIYEPKLQYSLPEGKLIGIDRGEFGGGLYYKPKDTTKKNFVINGKKERTIANPWYGGLEDEPDVIMQYGNPFLIKNGNVKFIFPFQDSICVIEGLAHMSLRMGMIYSLKLKDNRFTLANPYDFRDTPEAITIYNNKLFVVSDQGLFVISKNGRQQVLSNMFWNGLFPNTIAVKDERNIFIGMQGGYAKIDLPGKKVDFYKYVD